MQKTLSKTGTIVALLVGDHILAIKQTSAIGDSYLANLI